MQNEQILKKMLEDMSYRGYTKNTKDTYIRNVKVFMRYYKKSIEELTEKDILKFMKYLSEERKLKNKTVNIYNSSIRFMYEVTLDKVLNFKQIPLFKVRRKIPDMLTKEEIAKIFDNCKNLKHKAMFMTIYGGGLRVTELVKLKVKDIDSKEMRIFIKDGKGERDRYTILSDENLKILREYYLKYKPKNTEGYLFPSDNKSKKAHADRNAVERAFTKLCKKKCKINKKVTVHTLRHCFATHLYESGVELVNIQELLGHASIRSTIDYLHVANINRGIISPLDELLKVGDNNA